MTMSNNFFKSKVKLSSEEKTQIIDFLQDYGDISSIFRMAMFVRRIEISESLINMYQGNFVNIINQIISIIESSIRTYQSFNINIERNVPVKGESNYIANLFFFDDSSNEAIKRYYDIQKSIKDFLVSNSVNVEEKEYIDVDNHPFFVESKNRFNWYKDKFQSVGSLDMNLLSNTDKFYFLIKERQKEFINCEDKSGKTEYQCKHYYKILLEEIDHLISRINIHLTKWRFNINLSVSEIFGGVILVFRVIQK